MFAYRGSQLEQDLKELKESINKTEYEKAIEPFKKQIAQLEKKIYKQTKDMESLYRATQDFINGIEQNYIDIIVNLDKPEIYVGPLNESEPQKCKMEKMTIPIKQDLKECFINKVNHYKNKYYF